MKHEDSHLSDQELLLAADGELPTRRAAQVRDHLSACWACRTRMGEIEATIAEFVRVHYRQFDPRLPPADGSRALLKAHLAQLTAASPRHPWQWFVRFLFSGRGLVYISASLTLVSLGMLMVSRGILRRDSGPAPDRFEAGAEPKTSLTPGATRPVTKDDVCATENAETVRIIPASLQRKVFQEYGMANVQASAYEVDYLITPELGGADDIRNLWPEPYAATVWNAYVKDALEERLHRMVCAGQVDLATAQRDISRDWISAYKKYFHSDRPVSP